MCCKLLYLPLRAPLLYQLINNPTAHHIVAATQSRARTSCLLRDEGKSLPPNLIIVVLVAVEIQKLHGWIFVWIWLAPSQTIDPITLRHCLE